jgi:formylglycine-generating enzyme required for sulfatase activity
VDDPSLSWRAPGFSQDDSHPVVCINWNDANAYTAWLSQTTAKPYRLLSEAKREYVTRAGTLTPFWWGSSITPAQANYNGRGVYKWGGSHGEWRQSTVPVGSFEPNPWGLYNVHGNVFEWCEDVWHSNYSGAPVDGSAWLKGGDVSRRVLRGGSWLSDPGRLRSAFRIGHTSDFRKQRRDRGGAGRVAPNACQSRAAAVRNPGPIRRWQIVSAQGRHHPAPAPRGAGVAAATGVPAWR